MLKHPLAADTPGAAERHFPRQQAQGAKGAARHLADGRPEADARVRSLHALLKEERNLREEPVELLVLWSTDRGLKHTLQPGIGGLQ